MMQQQQQQLVQCNGGTRVVLLVVLWVMSVGNAPLAVEGSSKRVHSELQEG